MRPLAAAMTGILSTALTATGACAPTSRHVASDIEDPEAYAVYAALLPSEWTVKVARAKRLVIQKETVTNWACMPTGNALEFARHHRSDDTAQRAIPWALGQDRRRSQHCGRPAEGRVPGPRRRLTR